MATTITDPKLSTDRGSKKFTAVISFTISGTDTMVVPMQTVKSVQATYAVDNGTDMSPLRISASGETLTLSGDVETDIWLTVTGH